MSQTLIKVYDPEYLIVNDTVRVQQLMRMDFQPYAIKAELNKLVVLENENLVLFSILYDQYEWKIDHKQMMITLHTKNKTQKQTQEIMAIKCSSESQLNQITKEVKILLQQIYQLSSSQVYSSYMGPLSFQPIRKSRTSLLSSESPEQNFRGIVNLAILILIANHIRLILENFRKYGLLFKNITHIRIAGPTENPQLFAMFYLALTIMIAYAIQQFQFKQRVKPSIIRALNIINIASTFIVSTYIIQGAQPLFNLGLLMVQCVVSLKLISYAHVMRNTYFYIGRIKQVESKKLALRTYFSDYEISTDNLEFLEKSVQNYDKLLNLHHYLYFMLAPTLCFQFHYIRSPKIRKIWLIKRVVEYLFTTVFQIIIWVQYVEPLVNNTYHMLKEDSSIVVLLDRLLKLAIPNTYIWIAGFFGMFQCWLNIWAEILRFADREFYKDWWNCKNLEQYWRLWNLPVHHWLLRHLYFPCLKYGLSKSTANMIVFLISAIGHEYVISASLGVFGYIAFLGMMVQAPVILVQKRIEKLLNLQDSQLGNLMFWCTFCFIGQPVMIFVYYFRYLEGAQH